MEKIEEQGKLEGNARDLKEVVSKPKDVENEERRKKVVSESKNHKAGKHISTFSQ